MIHTNKNYKTFPSFSNSPPQTTSIHEKQLTNKNNVPFPQVLDHLPVCPPADNNGTCPSPTS